MTSAAPNTSHPLRDSSLSISTRAGLALIVFARLSTSRWLLANVGGYGVWLLINFLLPVCVCVCVYESVCLCVWSTAPNNLSLPLSPLSPSLFLIVAPEITMFPERTVCFSGNEPICTAVTPNHKNENRYLINFYLINFWPHHLWSCKLQNLVNFEPFLIIIKFCNAHNSSFGSAKSVIRRASRIFCFNIVQKISVK